jgi:hypothetical protein
MLEDSDAQPITLDATRLCVVAVEGQGAVRLASLHLRHSCSDQVQLFGEPPEDPDQVESLIKKLLTMKETRTGDKDAPVFDSAIRIDDEDGKSVLHLVDTHFSAKATP